MLDELNDLSKKLGEVYSALNKLNTLDFSKIQYSNPSSEVWDKINFINACFNSDKDIFNLFLKQLSVERAIRQRVKKRFYVINSKDILTTYKLSDPVIEEFHSEFDAYKDMVKRNKSAENLFKRKLLKSKKTYAIHSYDPDKDVFVKLTSKDLKDIEERMAQVEHGFF